MVPSDCVHEMAFVGVEVDPSDSDGSTVDPSVVNDR